MKTSHLRDLQRRANECDGDHATRERPIEDPIEHSRVTATRRPLNASSAGHTVWPICSRR